MRIFLTGASGFIGNRVLPLLEGHEVLCLAQTSKDVSKKAHIYPLVGDLAEPNKWRAEVKQFAPEWCIHLAWEGLPDYSLPRCRTNLNTSIELIEILIDTGIKRIIVAGSCWEYGRALGAVKEDHATINGCNIFATSKRSLQMMLECVACDYGIEYRWARFFFIYGPNQRTTSLIPQCYSAYSKGKQPEIHNPMLAQDFIYVDDAARGLVAIARANIGSGVFNIGSGVPTTVAYVANRVANHFGVPPLFSSKKHESGFWADTTKTIRTTGWMSEIAIDDGITQTLRALGSNL